MLAILATLAIMYLAPLPIYGGLSLVSEIEPPSPDSPGQRRLKNGNIVCRGLSLTGGGASTKWSRTNEASPTIH